MSLNLINGLEYVQLLSQFFKIKLKGLGCLQLQGHHHHYQIIQP